MQPVMKKMLHILLMYLIVFNIHKADADGLNYQVSRGRYYSTVRIQSSGYLCISNSPSMIIKSISMKQCTQECFRHAGCDDFNVFDGGTGNVDCQLYVKSNPLNYTVKANCRAYQAYDKTCAEIASVRAPSGPTGNLIPARCCSFPFTLNDVINYRCVINTPLVDVGCYVPKRTWATCQLPADFTSLYVTYNMTMPGNPSVKIPVQSINSWIVIHNHVIGGVTSFTQNWVAYRNGFGSASLSDNFWLGNELVYQLTSAANYYLRVEVQRPTTLVWQSAEYSSFSLGSESTKYTLRVSGFSGDAVDAFNPSYSSYVSNGRAFSTNDSDNDACSCNCASQRDYVGWCSCNCASQRDYVGWCSCNCASQRDYVGWWYNRCSTSFLTGRRSAAAWYHDIGQEMYPMASRMMIRMI